MDIFFGFALTCIALSILYCVFTTRRFTSVSVVQMQKSGAGGLNLDSLGGGGGGPADALSANIDIQTQSSILQSETLALQVFHDLHLEHNVDFAKYFVDYKPDEKEKKSGILNIENRPLLREKVVKALRKHLKVSSVAGTRLIEVSYDNPDPEVAAAVVNHYIQDLTEYTFEVQFTATNQASAWLEGQLSELRRQSQTLQSNLVALQRRTGLFGTTDSQGRVSVFSPVLQQMEQSVAELSRAEANRILKESIDHTVASGNADLISQLSGTMSGDSGAGVQSSLQLIQALRGQEAQLEAQIADESTKFGYAYPRLIEHKASLVKVQESLNSEVKRIADRAHNDALVARSVEDRARTQYEQMRQAAVKQNDMTIEYSILQKEADQSAELYRDLLKRLREAGILEGLHSHNLTVVDPARTPAKPSKPNMPVALILGFLLGPALGGAASFFWNSLDDSISFEGIQAMKLVLFGMLPSLAQIKATNGIMAVEQPLSAYSEALRQLRSAIMLSSSTPPRVLGVTSSIPGEGKSTTSLNLAASFAQSGKHVLLIEADMRKPVLEKRLQLHSTGLSRVLANTEGALELAVVPQLPTLSILTAGPVPPLPAELLASTRFHTQIEAWKQEFDYILIDLPPVLPVTDAQIMAPLVDSFLLVVRSESTSRTSLQRAYGLLQPLLKQGTIGIVLNAVDPSSAAHNEYYGYKQTGYYGTGDAA